jgi:hypothetical protein
MGNAVKEALDVALSDEQTTVELTLSQDRVQTTMPTVPPRPVCQAAFQ